MWFFSKTCEDRARYSLSLLADGHPHVVRVCNSMYDLRGDVGKYGCGECRRVAQCTLNLDLLTQEFRSKHDAKGTKLLGA